MNRWKGLLLLILLTGPVLVFVAVGGWAVWRAGWWFYLWLLFPLGWGSAYLLIRWWRPTVEIPAGGPISPPAYWTERDQQALAIVEAEQRRVREIDAQKLVEPSYYLERAKDLSLTIARHYHPRAEDPFSSLTLPEVLAAAHLALEELERWVERYVPGSHLLTIRRWRTLSNAPTWMRVASEVSWLASMIWSPLNAGRYVLSRMTMDSTSRQLQANLLAWFYVMFIRHVGFYLIEMNSGRLRGGADRYRAVTGHGQDSERAGDKQSADKQSADKRSAGKQAGDQPPGTPAERGPREVTIAVVGQVKAGKSSVINALLGERRAATDVVPLTKNVQEYRLTLPHSDDRLVLLDTAGYADAGATREQLDQAREAIRRADLVLLVLRATSPARAPDVNLMNAVRDWYADNPEHKPPPILGVLTHIDGLRPVMEWSPPYDWQNGTRPKEISIREAVRFNIDQFETLLVAITPVCADTEQQRTFGVGVWLLPAIAALLGEARGCAVLRTLHADLDAGRVRKTFNQLRSAGWQVIQAGLWGPTAS